MSIPTTLSPNIASTGGLPPTATGKAAAASGSSTGSTPADAIGSTFLSLLVQELQNQDPTAPMDSTAMVGQMISLNQLNQLTNINQVLTNAYGSGSTATKGSSILPPVAQVQTVSQAQATTQAALRQLHTNTGAQHAALAPSVTLPAF